MIKGSGLAEKDQTGTLVERNAPAIPSAIAAVTGKGGGAGGVFAAAGGLAGAFRGDKGSATAFLGPLGAVFSGRSEERRVGKECRARWGAYDEKQKRGA